MGRSGSSKRLHRGLGILIVGLGAAVAGSVAAQTPPIFQPGAPGAPSRVISANEAVALSRTTYTADDVAFMQHMIVHHAQAVEMVALLRVQGADPTVKRLGERIALGQEAEMELMRNWLLERGEPVAMPGHGAGRMDHSAHGGMDHAAHAGHAMAASETPLMAGMLSPAQMQRLAAAQGPAFDRLFLEGMIQHHQGAIGMVEALMTHDGAAQDHLLSDFTSAVVADQSSEILRMQTLLSDLNPQEDRP
jgi:uncharacterized protein (DUF305 family)